MSSDSDFLLNTLEDIKKIITKDEELFNKMNEVYLKNIKRMEMASCNYNAPRSIT